MASNSLDHNPVLMQMELPVGTGKNENVIIKCKPNWDNCDKQNYQLFTQKNLRFLLSWKFFRPGYTLSNRTSECSIEIGYGR